MSQKSVKDFFGKVVSDPKLLARLKATDDLRKIVSIAKAEGFEFSTADLRATNPPYRRQTVTEARLHPPIDTLGCSQSQCNYTSYVKKCSGTKPKKLGK